MAGVRQNWKDIASQRKFLNEAAKKLRVADPAGWSNVTKRNIIDLGGHGLLNKYSGSLKRALVAAYPDIFQLQTEGTKIAFKRKDEEIREKTLKATSGNRTQKNRGHWQNLDNQRSLVLKIAARVSLNATELDRLRSADFYSSEDEGGKYLLRKYNFSVPRLIKQLFPEQYERSAMLQGLASKKKWDWTTLSSQRQFMNEIAKDFGLQKISDWKKIGKKVVVDRGGTGLLNRYNGSFIKALKAIYPEEAWDPDKVFTFKYPIYPPEHFKDVHNQRKFLDDIAASHNVKHRKDWKRITKSLVRARGGSSLLKIFSNSVEKAVSAVYGENEGNAGSSPAKAETSQSKEQESLANMILNLFAGTEVKINFKHPKLIHRISGRPMEIDFWIPTANLAIEYQGRQHYDAISKWPQARQLVRDEEKRLECTRAGITLIEIPYWWNRSGDQLVATIRSQRPDLLTSYRFHATNQSLEALRIPDAPQRDIEFLLSEEYRFGMNPTGWWITEKMDGLRSYWDGADFYFRGGNSVKLPEVMKSHLPAVALDGELWAGRQNFTKCQAILRSFPSVSASNTTKNEGPSGWEPIQYQVFDAPDGGAEEYEARIERLRSVVRPDNPFVKVVEAVKCEGTPHLLSLLSDCLHRGGEGLVLRQPHSKYVPKRSTTMLKVKPKYYDTAVIIQGEEDQDTVKVRNSMGVEFKLLRKVSQRKFPRLAVNSVITYAFCGMSSYGVPRFAILKFHHENVRNEDEIVHYFFGTGTKSHWTEKEHFDDVNERPNERIALESASNCASCGLRFGSEDIRIQVKGMKWSSEQDKEPLFAMFAFCSDRKCVTQGQLAQDITLPPFKLKVGLGRLEKSFLDTKKVELLKFIELLKEQDIDTVDFNDQHVNEAFYSV